MVATVLQENLVAILFGKSEWMKIVVKGLVNEYGTALVQRRMYIHIASTQHT